jgi:hypothetical protein
MIGVVAVVGGHTVIMNGNEENVEVKVQFYNLIFQINIVMILIGKIILDLMVNLIILI